MTKKVYLIQEAYTCTVEDSLGECREEQQNSIEAVCLSREAMVKALPVVISENAEEYYTVGIGDYRLFEAEIVDDGFVTFSDSAFRIISLTDEERKQIESKADALINERIARYGG